MVFMHMPRKSPGGPRGAVLNVRIPEKTKFGLALMSRLYHEPIPDIVIQAINSWFTSENGGLFVDMPGENLPKDLLSMVWDDEECLRLAKLAFRYPTLLSGAELRIWQRIKADDKYWATMPLAGRTKRATEPVPREEANLKSEVLLADWEQLRQDRE